MVDTIPPLASSPPERPRTGAGETTLVSFAPRMDEAAARLALRRGATKLVYLELVWMPYALVTATTATATVRCLVDRVNGDSYRLASDAELEEETCTDCLPAALPLEECRKIGERFLIRSMIVLRSASRALAIQECRACSYPVFVGYRERRRGKLDIRILDAVTGKICGTGVKRAFLAAAATSASATVAAAQQRA